MWLSHHRFPATTKIKSTIFVTPKKIRQVQPHQLLSGTNHPKPAPTTADWKKWKIVVMIGKKNFLPGKFQLLQSQDGTTAAGKVGSTALLPLLANKLVKIYRITNTQLIPLNWLGDVWSGHPLKKGGWWEKMFDWGAFPSSCSWSCNLILCSVKIFMFAFGNWFTQNLWRKHGLDHLFTKSQNLTKHENGSFHESYSVSRKNGKIMGWAA